MKQIILNAKTLSKIYDGLVDIGGASESMRNAFLYHYSLTHPTTEWRFGGKMGHGAKFRVNNNGVYVDYYQEDESMTNDFISNCLNKWIKSCIFTYN